MDKNKTDVTVIMDRSGSMMRIMSDTIGGYNTFKAAQAKGEGSCNWSLVLFDEKIENPYLNVPVSDCPDLTSEVAFARGSTALYDAIGQTINSVGARLAALPESERPATVIISIMTDGFENTSREFNASQIQALITEQQDTYNWQFLFVGANQDAIFTARTLGIRKSHAMTYAANSKGTEAVFKSLGRSVSRSRDFTAFSGVDITTGAGAAAAVAAGAFEEADIKAQTDAGA